MDKLRIHRGLTRYSSPGWEVRLFRFAPDVTPTREAAPELRHAGLFLAFGVGLNRPVVLPRQIPLFGEVASFPQGGCSGAIFLTTAHDTLQIDDLNGLSECLFGLGRSKTKIALSANAQKLEEMFRQVLADAYHVPAAA